VKTSLVLVVVVISLVAASCAGSVDEGPATVDSPPSTADPPDVADDSEGSVEAQPTAPPPIDLDSHSVPLDAIHFDTFDGSSVPLSESTPELRARLLDAIPPVDDPVYGDIGAGDWLAPTDLVVGYVAGTQAYAYPFKILNFHEIVNDELAGVAVLISYCPLCRSAIVYDRRVAGNVLRFGNTSALYESDLVMVDRTTGSYWWQVAGSAIVGPLTGATLEPLPSSVATWKDWTATHPDTLVLSRDTGYPRPYERDGFAGYAEAVDSGRFAFPVGEAARDGRLPAAALVVGVVRDGITRVYPVEGRSEPINDEIGGQPIVVFPGGGGATVFDSAVDGATLEFERRGEDLVDVQTGSVWSAAGVAISGAMAGTTLAAVPSRTTFWFAFVGAFPDAELNQG
jgi:hypothetical protein